MQPKQKFNLFGLLGLCGLFVVSCASPDVKRSNISATANPSEEIQRIETKMEQAHNEQLDVLAPEALNESQEWLKEAREDMEEGDDTDEIIEALSISEGYLDRAFDLADNRKTRVEGILDARMAALGAGVRTNGELREDLKELDDEMRDKAENFAGEMSSEDFAELQSKYLNLETRAVQHRHLGQVRSQIETAEDYKAKRHAPSTLSQAKKALKNAENRIAVSPRDSSSFMPAVTMAEEEAKYLEDVVMTLRNRDYDISESVAIQLVEQNRSLQEKEARLAAQQQMLQFQDETITQQDRTISSQDQVLGAQSEALREASQRISMQQAIDQVRNEFGEEEAEVYQQGDKLIVRMKKINFPSGGANLPEGAMPILEKVSEISKDLAASQIVVQGHTDSTGSKQINEKLSKQRANTVASFFKNSGVEAEVESEGYGPNRPLAPNTTKEGRALNRRVDVVISTQDSSRAPASVNEEDASEKNWKSKQKRNY